jgi:hypothetical protein
MKKLIFISFSILIISFLASCNKAEDFSILEGRVIEKGSNKPIPDAMIVIQHCGGNFGQSGGVSCSNIDTIYSDKQGNFKHLIELTGDEYNTGAGNYFLVPSKEKYFSYQVEDYKRYAQKRHGLNSYSLAKTSC